MSTMSIVRIVISGDGLDKDGSGVLLLLKTLGTARLDFYLGLEIPSGIGVPSNS